MDWDEEHKFKNQIRGLNDDEVDFLDKIDDIRTDVERKRILDERKELEDFEKRQQELREKELLERLEIEKKSVIKKPSNINQSTNKNSQMKLLVGAVKRKSEKANDEPKKTKVGNESDIKNENTEKTAASGLLGLAAYGSDSDESD